MIYNAQVTPVRSKYLYPDRMRTLRIRSYESGARHRTTRDDKVVFGHLEANFAGSCQSPSTVQVQSRPELKRERFNVIHKGNAQMSTAMTMEVRCRKCAACLKARAYHWRMRAVSEFRMNPGRTWFGTLTFSPENHMAILNECRVGNIRKPDRLPNSMQGIDHDSLPETERFAALVAASGYRVGNMFKRLRKEGHEFRYLLVAEAHASGRPHYHLLVHEKGEPIPKRQLEAQWAREGFSSWRLVKDDRAASYVCKYLAKSALARVRASLDYGSPENALKA